MQCAPMYAPLWLAFVRQITENGLNTLLWNILLRLKYIGQVYSCYGWLAFDILVDSWYIYNISYSKLLLAVQ